MLDSLLTKFLHKNIIFSGPDVGGPHGPYRQSERTHIYNEYIQELVEKGVVYPDFCTDEELNAMKAAAELEGRPPVYTGTMPVS